MNFKTISLTVVLAVSLVVSAKTVSLFNGKDLRHWYAFESVGGRHDNAGEVFQVENNLIRLYGKEAGYLMSKKSFSNFKLTAEYRWNLDTLKFTQKNTIKNSGIMYLVPDTVKDEFWPAGIQCQIKQGYTGDFIFLNNVTAHIHGKETTAGKSVIYTRFADAEKPAGQWNKVEITFRNGVITQKLNGKTVNKAENPSLSSGRILLQYEGYPIDFRRIKMIDVGICRKEKF